MTPESFQELISDILNISLTKIRVVSAKIPEGGWTVLDVLVNDKPICSEQSQAVADILFWQQWWAAGAVTSCPKCDHKLGSHSKHTEREAVCNKCDCTSPIESGVSIREGYDIVIQALTRLRRN